MFPLLLNLKNAWKMLRSKKKNLKNFEAKKKETKSMVKVKPLQIKNNNLKQQRWNITDKLLTVIVCSFLVILALLKINN